MKKDVQYFLLLLSVVLICFEKSNAQLPNWGWARATGSINMDLVASVAVDDSGNVYTTGYFTDTVDFDPGVDTFNLISSGNEDIFIYKLNNNGNFVWAKSIGGTDYDWGYSLKLDATGNVYVAGFFSAFADFDPGSGSFILTSAGNNDAFVLKLDNDGNFIWAKEMGGSTSDAAQSIALDDSDNVYITGSYFGSADFDPDSTATFTLTSTGELEIFIAKLDSSGNFAWAKSIGGVEDDQGYSIAVDSFGNVYTTGYFEKTADFDPGTGVFNLTSNGNLPDNFISKLDRSGNFVWAKSMSGPASNDGYAIVVDKLGYVYSTGSFLGTVDFDPDTTVNFDVTAAGAFDIFISKLDSAGNFVWAKSMGGTDDDQSFAIAVDDSGYVYTTGIFGSAADFNPDAASSFILISSGGFDLFISKIDSAGNFVDAKKTGGSSRDQGSAITIDRLGGVLIGGHFYSPSITFGTHTFTNTDSLSLNSDLFIARLGKEVLTQIEQPEKKSKVSVFPNPSSESIVMELSLPVAEVSIEIFDVTGKIYYKAKSGSVQKLNISTAHFPSGLYTVQIKSFEIIETKKIIIEK